MFLFTQDGDEIDQYVVEVLLNCDKVCIVLSCIVLQTINALITSYLIAVQLNIHFTSPIQYYFITNAWSQSGNSDRPRPCKKGDKGEMQVWYIAVPQKADILFCAIISVDYIVKQYIRIEYIPYHTKPYQTIFRHTKPYSGPQCVPVLLGLIEKISSIRLYMPDDLRPKDARQAFDKSITEVHKRFPHG